jgi:hypothetical protein
MFIMAPQGIRIAAAKWQTDTDTARRKNHLESDRYSHQFGSDS